MKHRYFLLGTVFGCVAAYFVASNILGEAFDDMVGDASLRLPMIIGVVNALVLGYVLDMWSSSDPTIERTITSSMFIFAFGAISGLVTNFLSSGTEELATRGLTLTVQSWFIKPGYWLVIFGLPLAAVSGVVYWILFKILFGRK